MGVVGAGPIVIYREMNVVGLIWTVEFDFYFYFYFDNVGLSGSDRVCHKFSQCHVDQVPGVGGEVTFWR